MVALSVAEGDLVEAGQELARIVDDKLDFQLAALAAQREALTAQLANAAADLKRGESLLKDGVTTTQRVDALRTQVDVLTLTATPIPRTLQMAMSSLRDLSIIATAPAGRLAIIRAWRRLINSVKCPDDFGSSALIFGSAIRR